jgi:hypothetical protein
MTVVGSRSNMDKAEEKYLALDFDLNATITM